ncbi:MAG: pirin-like C-terminal cupin domain-containing protein, partial [Flavobacteriaceae bacterium]
HLLVLQGKPILEPVVQYGPFVMNSQQEIEKAMEDYRLTRFGGWPWPYPDQVHEREKGRFALYPDGKLIEK